MRCNEWICEERRMKYRRALSKAIGRRLEEGRGRIQVVSGPRQVGKTTAMKQALEGYGGSWRYVLADGLRRGTPEWLEAEWEGARLVAASAGDRGHWLVVDEVQKVEGWSETVKRLWDEDSFAGRNLKVALLGSSRLLLQKGLGESLAGRFEALGAWHWSFREMRDAFGFGVEDYVAYGGYPGGVELRGDEERWRGYVAESIAEPSLSRDVLQLEPVAKPALLRQVFVLACAYSARVLSYQKMLGQLQDAGNAATVAHYLRLLGEAGLVKGLEKHAGETVRTKASSPKLAVCNNALATAMSPHTVEELRRKPELRGRAVESAVGAHLLATAAGTGVEVEYWNEGGQEVDFVLRKGQRVAGLEVKSGGVRGLGGLGAFKRRFPGARTFLVGGDGIGLEEFFGVGAEEFLR